MIDKEQFKFSINTMPYNRSETFISNLCENSFFRIWSYPNPKRELGSDKEFCDVLVVCNPDIIILSVKERVLNENKNLKLESQRWLKKTITNSITQIDGAERQLSILDNVIKENGEYGISLPQKGKRVIHRIVVAIGSKGRLPLPLANNDSNFVHVFDEMSFSILISEMDTISDFIQYITCRKQFILSKKSLSIQGGEENLLAVFLENNRQFPYEQDVILIDNPLWDNFSKSDAYLKKKKADQVSIYFDKIIKEFEKHLLEGTLEFNQSLNNTEQALRVMAKETRLNRRILGKSFVDFYNNSPKGYETSRIAISPSGTTYVFLTMPHNEDREYRKQRLALRCSIARVKIPQNRVVIGIATEQLVKSKGHSFDLFYFSLDEINKDFEAKMIKASKEFKMFNHNNYKKSTVYEYPTEDPNS